MSRGLGLPGVASAVVGLGLAVASTFASSIGLSTHVQRISFGVGVALMAVGVGLGVVAFVRARRRAKLPSDFPGVVISRVVLVGRGSDSEPTIEAELVITNGDARPVSLAVSLIVQQPHATHLMPPWQLRPVDEAPIDLAHGRSWSGTLVFPCPWRGVGWSGHPTWDVRDLVSGLRGTAPQAGGRLSAPADDEAGPAGPAGVG